MPLPLILGAAAAIAGATGVGVGIHGGVKMKDAKDTMEAVERKQKENLKRFEKQSEITNKSMDALGEEELNILHSFESFSNLMERIHNRPEFQSYDKSDVKLPDYNEAELKEVSVGAGVLLGGIGGAAAGTAGGFAAAGAATSAVMALGTASTGTSIAALSGAAATNATLAALGGGTIAAGGGGVALGTTVLGAATLGIGLLVGGAIFSITGSSLQGKADEAWSQVKKAEKEIDKICDYLKDLKAVAEEYCKSLVDVKTIYQRHYEKLQKTIEKEGKTDWDLFTDSEKLVTQNTVLLVGLLYKMCKVQLVLKSEDDEELNTINREEVSKSIHDAKTVIDENELRQSV